MPPRGLASRGTPITGRVVWAATAPARCAAIPAPAMNTAQPRSTASVTYCEVAAGVRWAEVILTSTEIPRRRSTSTADCITGQSESEPMSTATKG